VLKNRKGQVRTGLDVVLANRRTHLTRKSAQVWVLLNALQKLESESRQASK